MPRRKPSSSKKKKAPRRKKKVQRGGYNPFRRFLRTVTAPVKATWNLSKRIGTRAAERANERDARRLYDREVKRIRREDLYAGDTWTPGGSAIVHTRIPPYEQWKRTHLIRNVSARKQRARQRLNRVDQWINRYL